MNRPPQGRSFGGRRFQNGPGRAQPEVPGLATRRVAARLVDGVLSRTRSLDASLEIEHGRILKCKGWEHDPNAYIYFITQAAVWEPICDIIGEPSWKT
ncbi:hypothetical protein ACIKT0_15455, partial [Hansschlegelia beijingensis]|uniref:hypothetical protein n=1 Tax=Hansschlegelia beijingensis TaxID=1133344 RepID=UPI00387F36FB